MKTQLRLRILLGLVACLALPFFANAATPGELREELLELKGNYENAINSGDLSTLQSLFEDGTSGVTVDNQTFHNLSDLQAIYDRFHVDFPGVEYRIKLNPEPAVFFGNIALVTGTCYETVKTAAGQFEYTSAFTAVLRRGPSGWTLLRSQVTMDPFRNSIVLFLENKTKVTYGLLGLAGGVALGFFLCLFFVKRRQGATAVAKG